MKTCAIVQSSYIPWRGYFDLIRRADVFVFLDQVQFTRRDWRTRNKILTATGPIWLSVPVRVEKTFGTKIFDVEIDSSQNWNRAHLKSIEHAYAKAPYRDEVLERISPIYAEPPARLVELNRKLTQILWDTLSANCTKSFIGDEEFELPSEVEANQRLISICKAVEAEKYLSGPSAAGYMDLDAWKSAGIEVEFMNYNYSNYFQLYGEFEPAVSIIDVLMNLGLNSIDQALR